MNSTAFDEAKESTRYSHLVHSPLFIRRLQRDTLFLGIAIEIKIVIASQWLFLGSIYPSAISRSKLYICVMEDSADRLLRPYQVLCTSIWLADFRLGKAVCRIVRLSFQITALHWFG